MDIQGLAREGGPWLPQSYIEWIFLTENWFCQDIGPALFRKVTVLSARSVLVKYAKKYGPRCCRSSSFQGDD